MIFPQFAPDNYVILDPIIHLLGDSNMSNDIGNKFGKWTVIEFIKRDAKSNKIYKCRCDCGFEKELRICTLRRNNSTQCKKCRMSVLNKVEDILGKQFGFWTVLEKIKDKLRNECLYICQCKCGRKEKIVGYTLRNGRSNKCPECRAKTHGMSYTDTFKIWAGILRRCLNSNFSGYKYYGGRGIKVCDRWLKFENFYEDMGDRPYNLQIDRIDNNGNYEPGNCRWVTAKINNANRSASSEKKGIK